MAIKEEANQEVSTITYTFPSPINKKRTIQLGTLFGAVLCTIVVFYLIHYHLFPFYPGGNGGNSPPVTFWDETYNKIANLSKYVQDTSNHIDFTEKQMEGTVKPKCLQILQNGDHYDEQFQDLKSACVKNHTFPYVKLCFAGINLKYSSSMYYTECNNKVSEIFAADSAILQADKVKIVQYLANTARLMEQLNRCNHTHVICIKAVSDSFEEANGEISTEVPPLYRNASEQIYLEASKGFMEVQKITDEFHYEASNTMIKVSDCVQANLPVSQATGFSGSVAFIVCMIIIASLDLS